MSDLTDFLLARIAEDEEAARAATADYGTATWRMTDDRDVVPDPAPGNSYVAVGPWDGGIDQASATHIARHDPARVLAECEAKRRIVEHETSRWVIRRGVDTGEVTLGRDEVLVDGVQMTAQEYGERMRELSDQVRDTPVLRALALPYVDHPEFREEWRL